MPKIITDRVRSTRGGYIFSLCVCPDSAFLLLAQLSGLFAAHSPTVGMPLAVSRRRTFLFEIFQLFNISKILSSDRGLTIVFKIDVKNSLPYDNSIGKCATDTQAAFFRTLEITPLRKNLIPSAFAPKCKEPEATFDRREVWA